MNNIVHDPRGDTELIRMVDEAYDEAHVLSEWEYDFILRIKHNIVDYNELSDKQKQMIIRINQERIQGFEERSNG